MAKPTRRSRIHAQINRHSRSKSRSRQALDRPLHDRQRDHQYNAIPANEHSIPPCAARVNRQSLAVERLTRPHSGVPALLCSSWPSDSRYRNPPKVFAESTDGGDDPVRVWAVKLDLGEGRQFEHRHVQGRL